MFTGSSSVVVPTGLELVARAAGSGSLVSPAQFTFPEFMHAFGKEYEHGTREYERREMLFLDRLDKVVSHNKDPRHSWTKGINNMTDWTDDEYLALMGYKPAANAQVSDVTTRAPKMIVDGGDLPETVDWRACNPYSASELCPKNGLKTPVVTPIKNQLACGSCYSFASIAVLESHLAISAGTYMDLSPQHVVSCAPNAQHCGGTGGCQGSTADVVYSWIHKVGGVASEFEYGYHSGDGRTGTCDTKRTTKVSAKVGPSLGKPASNNYTALMSAVLDGPVAVNVDASHWRDYESGVFDGCPYDGDITLNHVVALEGYGDGYWLIRNSWGPAYGESGYIRLKREPVEMYGVDPSPADGWNCEPFPAKVQVAGMCGVAFEPTQPTDVTN